VVREVAPAVVRVRTRVAWQDAWTDSLTAVQLDAFERQRHTHDLPLLKEAVQFPDLGLEYR
jgi:hypothetical protein